MVTREEIHLAAGNEEESTGGIWYKNLLRVIFETLAPLRFVSPRLNVHSRHQKCLARAWQQKTSPSLPCTGIVALPQG